MYLWYDCATTMVLFNAIADLPLVNHNYIMRCSIITVLICFALNHDCSTNTLGILLHCQYIVHWRIDLLNILLIFRISKLHLFQAGLSITLANYMKNSGYCYFTCLCPVVISISIAVSEQQHNYPTLKLYSISYSSALVSVHIIKIRTYVVKNSV